MLKNFRQTTLIIGIFSFILAGCSSASQQNPTPESEQVLGNTIEEVNPAPTGSVEREFVVMEDGQTALAVTEANAQVDKETYDYGTMVKGIDGVKADEKHYWALYINGLYAEAAADKTTVKTDDIVKWKLEEIDTSL